MLLTALAALPAAAELVPGAPEHTMVSGQFGSSWSLAATKTSFGVAFEADPVTRFHVLDASAQYVSSAQVANTSGSPFSTSYEKPILRSWSGGFWLLMHSRQNWCCSEFVVRKGYVARRFQPTGAPFSSQDIDITGMDDETAEVSTLLGVSNPSYLGQGRLMVHYRMDETSGGPPLTTYHVDRIRPDGWPQAPEYSVPSALAAMAIALDSTSINLSSIPATSPNVDLFANFHDAAGDVAVGPVAVSPTSYENGSNDIVAFDLPDGGFGVVWHQRNDPWGFRIFNRDGSPRTDAEWVDAPGEIPQFYMSVAVGPAGEIVFVWVDVHGVWARLRDAHGQSLSERVLVSAIGGGHHPQVVAAPNGRFLVGWQQPGTPTELRGRFLTGPTLFADGFESGDTAGWFDTHP